jgi:hypothetical protein
LGDKQRPADQRQATVETIAEKLGETNLHPVFQIRRIVQRLGEETALAILQETLEMEAQGGMMLPDSSRRRTPGGVFFQLVRQRLSPEDRAYCFPYPSYQQKKQARARRGKTKPPTQPPPQLPPLTWDNRLDFIRPSLDQKGTATTVKLTLTGRPGRIIQTASCVVTTLQSGPVPTLPQELPKPPDASTPYVVYIAKTQWETVAEALHNPEDELMVEGFPAYDPQLKGMAVFAMQVTTKLLQAAQPGASLN